MRDLSFDVALTWSGTGLEGAGQIQTDDVALQLSGPESMGGRGVGTNPKELLVCAVSSCYAATLFAGLRRAQLPVDSLAVAASGTVTGFPAATRFARIVVTPTSIGGDIARQPEYKAAASLAHDRCFIGRTLAPEVVYEVGSVHVRGDLALAPTPDQPLAGSEDAGERPSGSRFQSRHRRDGMNTSTSNVAKAGHDRHLERQDHPTRVEELAQFVCRSRWDDISEPAREQLKLRVLDSLGVALGALDR